MSVDAAIVAVAHVLAYAVRFEAAPPAEQWGNFLAALPWLMLVKPGVFAFFGLYAGQWRYTGLFELIRIAKAAAAASLLILAWLLIFKRFEGFSRSVFLLDWFFTLALVASFRIAVRLRFGPGLARLFGKARPGRPLLVIGAGPLAERLVRELFESADPPLWPVGVFDDADRGGDLHGVPLFGPVEALPVVLEGLQKRVGPIRDVVLAEETRSPERTRSVAALAEAAGLTLKTIVGPTELALGAAVLAAARPLDYRDLLPRKEAGFDESEVDGLIRGKVVLVTGAGGSIGAELVRRTVAFGPSRMVLVDFSEANLYAVEMELRHAVHFANCVAELADLKDAARMEGIFAVHKPDVVLHAAAYKHVPLLEHQPFEAVWNNVRASEILLDLCLKHAVECAVTVSTDKAVAPSSVMGATKRVVERLTRAAADRSALSGGRTRFAAVRFGNVLGSIGSVGPLFEAQIERGGPVTVTHPDMVRFFMTKDEAARLILAAAALAKGGELFVLRMGSPVRILDMARDMIRLKGLRPDIDVKIEMVGPRPGEKYAEALYEPDETPTPTANPAVETLVGPVFDPELLRRALEALYRAAGAKDGEAVKKALALDGVGFPKDFFPNI